MKEINDKTASLLLEGVAITLLLATIYLWLNIVAGRL